VKAITSYCTATGQPHPAATKRQSFYGSCGHQLPGQAVDLTPVKEGGDWSNPLLITDTPEQDDSPIQLSATQQSARPAVFIPSSNQNQTQRPGLFRKQGRTKAQLNRMPPSISSERREPTVIQSKAPVHVLVHLVQYTYNSSGLELFKKTKLLYKKQFLNYALLADSN
jgi:hypothetical protein